MSHNKKENTGGGREIYCHLLINIFSVISLMLQQYMHVYT